MQNILLSKRLLAIARHIPENTYFADIGADHAYLACYLCLRDPFTKGIASDVNEGPLMSAKKNVEKYNLENRIIVRLGDGLSVLKDDQIDTLIISGMGGALMKDILEEGKNKLSSVKRIVLQPNIGEELVRSWLINNEFAIVDEEILEENEKIYEIIVADRIHKDEQNLTKKQLYFGPLLLQRRTEIFIKKWVNRKIFIEKVIKQMKRSKNIDESKLTTFKTQLHWIKEVLKDEKN